MTLSRICAIALCLLALFGISANAVSAPDSEEQNTVRMNCLKLCRKYKKHPYGVKY